MNSRVSHAPPGGKVRCPLCEDIRESRLLEEIPYRILWDTLRKEWAIRVPEDIARRNAPAESCALHECLVCGLLFFPGAGAGDEAFYRAISGEAGYYAPARWEYGWVKERLKAGASVLDVGCGPGKFLLELGSLVSRAVGLEKNPLAIEWARGKGLEVYPADLDSFSREKAGQFDVACAFHVLEHVEAPVGFLRSLAACVRPGGEVFLSVPNRDRSARRPLEPLDCPPHHLHRWGPEQLRAVGGASGIRFREMAFEPVDISVPGDRLREAIGRGAGKIPVAGGFLAVWTTRVVRRIVLAPPLVSLYRSSGTFERMGYFGHSVAVRYLRPGPGERHG